jgi:hypothetical protein
MLLNTLMPGIYTISLYQLTAVQDSKTCTLQQLDAASLWCSAHRLRAHTKPSSVDSCKADTDQLPTVAALVSQYHHT